ncbi:MAG TPA: biliverdin-producing heme oxygenase [Polyangiaceae bacterium]|nr:biliverdin-producing heme oxygenase [Polyangiaceae bacterium]
MRRSRIHSQLKQETAAVHRRLEEQLDLLDPSLSRERYRCVLEAFYGFYEPVEAELMSLARAAPPLGLTLLSRHRLLRQDLIALGATAYDVEALPRCKALPPLSSPAHFGGYLYVLEGAALGGQIVARALARHVGIGQKTGAAFFSGDGIDTAQRWKRVLEWLDESFGADDCSEPVVSAAYATFATFSCWLNARGAAR